MITWDERRTTLQVPEQITSARVDSGLEDCLIPAADEVGVETVALRVTIGEDKAAARSAIGYWPQTAGVVDELVE